MGYLENFQLDVDAKIRWTNECNSGMRVVSVRWVRNARKNPIKCPGMSRSIPIRPPEHVFHSSEYFTTHYRADQNAWDACEIYSRLAWASQLNTTGICPSCLFQGRSGFFSKTCFNFRSSLTWETLWPASAITALLWSLNFNDEVLRWIRNWPAFGRAWKLPN